MASSPGFERQHPASWIFPAWQVVRAAIIPIAAALVLSFGFAVGLLAIFLVVPAAALGIAKHLALSFSLGDEELIVRDGILHRNERRIRYSRVQNLDEVQSLGHRLIGAVAIKVETAGGSEPEAVLHLSPIAADRLRRAIFRGRQAEQGQAATDSALIRVPVGELVRLGLIKNRGFVVVAAAVGALTQFDSMGINTAWWDRLESWVPGLLEDGLVRLELDWTRVVLAALALVLVAYLLLSALSISIAVVRFFGFTLRRQDDDLHARFGLLTRVQKVLPRRRIQRLKIEESLLHRLFRRLSIRLDTAGGTGGSAESASSLGEVKAAFGGHQWLAPLTVWERVEELVATALPRQALEPLERLPETTAPDNEDPPAPNWTPIAQRASRRLFDKAVLALLILTFALTWLSTWSLLLLLLTPVLWWVCRNYVAHRHYWLTRDALWWRGGWLGRELIVVPFEKIQSVSLKASPFDRRHRMASIVVDTARSGATYAASIRYLDADEAASIAGRLAAEAGRREFVWS